MLGTLYYNGLLLACGHPFMVPFQVVNVGKAAKEPQLTDVIMC